MRIEVTDVVEPPLAWLYRPLRGIPPETMAVHHITEADFRADTPVCTPEYLHNAVWSGPTPAALVAGRQAACR